MRKTTCLIGLLAAAGVATAQPTITSLGSGSPLSVTNSLSGTYYIGGTGVVSGGAGRWAFTSSGITTADAVGSGGGGQISKDDGDFLTSLLVNGPTRWAIGNATTAPVSPPYQANPASLAPSATSPAATEFGGARWSFLSSSHTTMGVVPTIPFTANPNPAAVAVSTITCLSGVATATTSAPHGLAVNDVAIIGGNSTSAYNGVVTVTAVPSATTFEYAVTCGANGTGGTMTKRVIDIGNSGVYGTSSGGSSTSNFLAPHGISANGRFIVGQNYVCAYNTAGTSISANSFYWRPVLWDSQGNAGAGSLVVLPTPFRTTNSSEASRTRRRTGNAYAVSNDGLVVAGATEHNTVTSGNADPDGSRLVVWRWNAGTSSFDMTYLDTGVDSSGFPLSISSTPSAVAMNSTGTIIAARGPSGITKWVWNGSTWGAPIVIGSNLGVTTPITSVSCSGGIVTVTTSVAHGLAVNANINISGNAPSGALPFGSIGFNGYCTVTAVPTATTFEYMLTSCPLDTSNNQITGTGGNVNAAASWVPFAVRSCGMPPSLGNILCMSEDGNTIGGSATYSTCGSFMQGGFIWHASDGLIQDWYDYNVSQGTPGFSTGGVYGPIGDTVNSVLDPSRGLPVAGNPFGMSPDASAIVGRQGGNQIIIGAPPWIWQASGGPTCIAPAISAHPAATTNFTKCSTIILNAAASGTAPFTYQWYRGATALVDGTTVDGSVVTGATSFQLRINTPHPADAGNYTCQISGPCGSPATTNIGVVQIDPALTAPTNDVCTNAASVGEGTFAFNPCGAWENQGSASCAGSADSADVWYRYTPTFTGNARFQTCGSNFDTTLALFDADMTNCFGAELANGCNEDVGARGLAGAGSSCSSTRSVITSFPVTTGVPLYVRVGGRGLASFTTTGQLVIGVAPAAPANDLCANATPVTGNSTTPFNLNDATDDYDIGVGAFCSLCPNDTQAASNRDVWFRLDSPCGGTYTITTCGSTISNPMIHVMSDDCFNPSYLRCSDNVGSGVSGCSSNQAGIGVGTCGTNATPLVITGPVLIRVSQSGTGSPGNSATSGTGQLVIAGTDNPCTACCAADGSCTVTTPGSCIGTELGAGTTCSPNMCPGACCCGSSCSITASSACAGLNQAFVPGGVCTPYSTTVPCCRGNYNKSPDGPGAPGGVSVQDIFDFLAGYFANDPCANANDSAPGPMAPNGISVQDIFDFLAAYFGGC
ncbi:MAG: immunoglobulin domain-containing protein [Phycisphaerales bacterium]|nr:immunoglobulin domain-containing protein [Phycisphaerales bacterium]